MSAVIRSDIPFSPGESDTRNAGFAKVIPDDESIEGTPTLAVERERGAGTMTATNAAAQGRIVSYVASMGDDATPGSVFVITITAASANGTYKVSERYTCVA